MIFVIEQINDIKFRREKDNLHTEINISLKDALLGFTREIKHLDEHTVIIKKDSVVQPGEILRIKGEGMPIHQKGDKGDLYVKINVIFPMSLSEKQLEGKKIYILFKLI